MSFSARPLFDNPADAELFVPRVEVERVGRNCRDGVNTLVLGERGMGKTSLLRNVAYRLREAGDPASVVDATPADDALGIIQLLTAELGRRQPAFMESFGRRFDPQSPTALGETGELLNAIRALRAPSEEGSSKTSILLDSPPAESAHTLFGRLRDELWQLPFTWVVAANQSQRAQFLTPPADVFFEDVFELAPLTQEQQIELVSRRLDPGEHTGWRRRQPDEGNPRILIDVTREAMRDGRDPDGYLAAHAERERQVHKLGRSASALYAELRTSGPASASDEDLLRRLGWSRQRAAQVFAELERVGVVRASDRPGPSGRPRKTFEIVPLERS